ncbi:MAG: SdrD B-like domain-containing protein [Propionibacteriaceae bacterium]|nr:SdrD B-like domain-containing protein [Propionibacteriaceae bacterium]
MIETNTYTQKLGSFQVVKTATGAPGVEDKEFSFDYVCGDVTGSVSAKGDGVAVGAGREFPVGTQCTVTEDAASAAVAGYDLAVPAAQTITIAEAPTVVEAAFTNTYTQKLVSAGGYVWYDANKDGQQGSDEKLAQGVTVTLLNADGTVVAQTVTDADGQYWFKDLVPGAEYTLKFDKLNGFEWTVQNQGDDTTDSDADASGVAKFTAPADGKNEVGAGATDLTSLDAGLVEIETPEPTPDPTTPTAEPTTPEPTPTTPAPTAGPTGSTPTVSPTGPTPTASPTSQRPMVGPITPVPTGSTIPSVAPTKPVPPPKPVRPGLPKTGH